MAQEATSPTRAEELVHLIRAVSGSTGEDAMGHNEAVALIERYAARVAAPVVGTGIPPSLPYGWTQEHAAKAAWMIGTLAITPTAIVRAVQVYAKEGDLTQAEEAFLLAVRRADVDYLESLNTANRLFGGGSKAWEATKFLAARQRNDDYSHALESLEASIDAADEVEEIELAMAAE